jgi:hypothetical protein
MEATQPPVSSDRPRLLAQNKAWLVEQGDNCGQIARENREWSNQARVLWEAARLETEPLVLLNLLRYQSARNSNWKEPRDVFTPLNQAVKECIHRAGKDSALALDLIRHLLVYTIRAHTYHEKLAREAQRGETEDGRPSERPRR